MNKEAIAKTIKDMQVNISLGTLIIVISMIVSLSYAFALMIGEIHKNINYNSEINKMQSEQLQETKEKIIGLSECYNNTNISISSINTNLQHIIKNLDDLKLQVKNKQ